MGSETRTKSKTIPVRVSPGEKKEIERIAKSINVSPAHLMRSSALGVQLTSKLDQQAILKLSKINADQARLGSLLKLWIDDYQRFYEASKDVGIANVTQLFNEIRDTQELLKIIILKL